MTGVCKYCVEKHVRRYLAEFNFRYNNRVALEVENVQRAVNALAGIEGKRLIYRRPD